MLRKALTIVSSLLITGLLAGCFLGHHHRLHVPPGHAKKAVIVGHKHGPHCGHIFRNGSWVIIKKKHR